jgi:5-methylthioadenosine/S-adenosylhomocysteine deaminase
MPKKFLSLLLLIFVICAFCVAIRHVQASAPQKERVDLLVSGGTVVTMDSGKRVIEDGTVAVRGDAILAVGARQEIESRYEAGRTIDAHGKIVMPGLINSHAHAAMSLFRGLADDLSLDDWLRKYIFPAEARNVTEDFAA